MTTAEQVDQAHREHPDWTSPDIAERLGCSQEFVRSVKRRRKLAIPYVKARRPGWLTRMTRLQDHVRLALISLREGRIQDADDTLSAALLKSERDMPARLDAYTGKDGE